MVDSLGYTVKDTESRDRKDISVLRLLLRICFTHSYFIANPMAFYMTAACLIKCPLHQWLSIGVFVT